MGFFVVASFIWVDRFISIAYIVRPLLFMFVPVIVFAVSWFVTIFALDVILMRAVMSFVRSLLAKPAGYFVFFCLRCGETLRDAIEKGDFVFSGGALCIVRGGAGMMEFEGAASATLVASILSHDDSDELLRTHLSFRIDL